MTRQETTPDVLDVVIVFVLLLAVAIALLVLFPYKAVLASPIAGPQATADVEWICDGPSWNLTLFPTLDGSNIFRMAIGKCLHPVRGRVEVFWYDNIYQEDRQVQLCYAEQAATKLRNCDPPVRVLTPRLP